jgi:hypothetical protein
MKFLGQGLPLSAEGMKRICALLGVPAPQIWAVLAVETRGFGFLPDRRPQILFERHVFQRLTQGRYDSTHADISNAKAGGYAGGTLEYARLAQAMLLDRKAALQSASWGIGQILGCNYRAAGFSGVNAMVKAMVISEDAQLLAMAKFIEGNRLAKALQQLDWAAFARGYNGADYKKNQYDQRLAAAHARYQVMLPDLALRRAQAALLYLGIDPGAIDGFRGRRTRAALIQFQARSGLRETGELNPACRRKLLAQAFPA